MSVSMGAKVVRLRPITPLLVTFMVPSGTALSRCTFELALVVLVGKAKWFAIIIMRSAPLRKLDLRVAVGFAMAL